MNGPCSAMKLHPTRETLFTIPVDTRHVTADLACTMRRVRHFAFPCIVDSVNMHSVPAKFEWHEKRRT
jgi:hypothetical protein